MSVIKIENLSFAYPGSYDNIFENLDLTLDSDWKLGLVGRNGRGKTTLLRILCGELEYSGKIISSVGFDYFPYAVPDGSETTESVLHSVCRDAEEWQIERELSYLDLDSDALERPFDTLSNGERTKALLAALFLNEGRFLLIDEPTNHLDAEARKLVSAYLRKKSGFILVSHDRRFIDGCVDHIMSINRSGIELQSGNFSSWLLNYERRQSSEEAQNEQLKKEIRRLGAAAKHAEAWSERAESAKYGGDTSKHAVVDRGYLSAKSARMMKRSKAIESRRQNAAAQKSELLKDTETAEELKLRPLLYRSERLAELKDLVVCYGGKEVCEPQSFEIKRGDRIALVGKNGSGKSSILKLLAGEDVPHTGTLILGSRQLKVSYVRQDSSRLCGDLRSFAEEGGIDESLFKAILRKMGFERVHFEKRIEELSEGQRKKLLLAKSLCTEAHLYVWDEPLNFIDVFSRLQIEELIRRFSPTMIFAEHDAAFRDGIANKSIEL